MEEATRRLIYIGIQNAHMERRARANERLRQAQFEEMERLRDRLRRYMADDERRLRNLAQENASRFDVCETALVAFRKLTLSKLRDSRMRCYTQFRSTNTTS